MVRLASSLVAALAFAANAALAQTTTPRPAAPASPAAVAAKGTVHAVGPTRDLKLPSDAAKVVKDGDIVEIDPGTYEDCAVWRANGLTLLGKGGVAHVTTKTCQGKAIWVLDGDNTTVERIRFTKAAVADKNGAGIRVTKGSLTVRNAVFEDNENGILTGVGPGKSVTIESSRFERNGKCEPDCAHGIYIGAIERLTVRNSTFRGQKIGHHIKSRAQNTTITGNTIQDGTDGTASYLIDIPNAGNALIAKNKLQKGVHSDNQTIAIAFGLEGVKNPTKSVKIEDNEFRSDIAKAVNFVRNPTIHEVTLTRNMLCGNVIPLAGMGEVKGEVPCKK